MGVNTCFLHFRFQMFHGERCVKRAGLGVGGRGPGKVWRGEGVKGRKGEGEKGRKGETHFG